jgi:hypothetical protein
MPRCGAVATANGLQAGIRFSCIPGISWFKILFLAPCQEYMLDKTARDTRFDQCLQGFRVLKKVVIMTCTKSAFCAIMGERKASAFAPPSGATAD